MKHAFTDVILAILADYFGDDGTLVYDASSLLQYLNLKTRSANRGSKARSAFANHYAIYVLVEDYINKGFIDEKKGQYSQYEGARFTDLLQRQRALPFGEKLQNHALNARLNDEYAKYFPTDDRRPILHDLQAQRYWVNEELLLVRIPKQSEWVEINIAEAIIAIIDAYVVIKRSAFDAFIESCRQIARLSNTTTDDAIGFIQSQLQPSVDARIFEIISFAILKAHYGQLAVYWGWNLDELHHDALTLYKTGRTNANDGGIDFVMRPLGRFFQVTESVDVNKYFLDIDKVQHYPLVFVVKTKDDPTQILHQIREQAQRKYGIQAIIARYMDAIEEIINIPTLITMFEILIRDNRLDDVMKEIILQSQREFNILDDQP